MKWTSRHSVLATILYSSLFEYPLTPAELKRFLITSSSVDIPDSLPKPLKFIDGYIFLEKDKKFIALRKKREKIAQKKWIIAKRVIQYLGHIPSLMCIGVSGGLSMNSVDEEDDIDLFIITKAGTMWISRLLVLLVLELLGKRRRFGQTEEKDLLCPNMFVTDEHLAVPLSEQDIYSAHEVLQLVPLIDKEETYRKFLLENAWASNYLANGWKEKVKQQYGEVKLRFRYLLFLLYIVELPAKYIQLWYMNNHRTTEVISDSMLRFHPHDTRESIKKRYPTLLSLYKVPLDSKFFKQLK